MERECRCIILPRDANIFAACDTEIVSVWEEVRWGRCWESSEPLSSCLSGPDCCGVSRMALCAHLHQSWGRRTPLFFTHMRFKSSPVIMTLICRSHQSKWCCPSYRVCLGGHHARVPNKEVRRTAHSYLPLCALPHLVCGHQDFSKSRFIP